MSDNTIVKHEQGLEQLKQLVTDSLTSLNSRVAYDKALTDFLAWYQSTGQRGLIKATVAEYKTYLQGLGYAPSTINQRLSAIRKLAIEAADNGLMDAQLANGVARVKGVKSSGVRTGNWLTKDQAQRLLDAPDITTLKGLRDRAILAVMLGAGLRRSEVAALTFEHIQQREGRWVIVDLIGKGKRVRTVPIPSWAKQAIDEWTQTAGISEGRIFRAVNKGDRLAGESLTSQAVQDVVKAYAKQCGFELAAHDLRRTFAKLARKGGADLMQIQLTLGHASVKTTERYLGENQDLTSAPCDVLGLKLYQ
mgnify:FL=1